MLKILLGILLLSVEFFLFCVVYIHTKLFTMYIYSNCDMLSVRQYKL